MRIPHADKRREAPPGDACGIVVAPMALVASLRPRIPAYQGAQVAAAWVGTSRPASWACRGATAAGNAMAKHWARVARRRDCAAFGYVVNRATSDRVQPLRFFILVGSREGCRRWPFRPWRGGRSPHGVWGCNPCRGATIGCGRDAGISGSRAAALAVGDPTEEWAKAGFFAERKNAILS